MISECLHTVCLGRAGHEAEPARRTESERAVRTASILSALVRRGFKRVHDRSSCEWMRSSWDS